jgi:molybdopterin/thiamine biosynthesis adenylyltransferase
MRYEEILETGAIKDYLRVYSFGEHNLQFGVFPENQRLVSDPTGIARRILERSFARQPFPEIRRELVEAGYAEEVVRQTFERLHELELLQETAQGADRYQRQRRFFEVFKDNFLAGEEYQAGVRAARVLVLGLDPLGVRVAHLLAVAGVGSLAAVDGRPLAADDLLHQHVFTADAVGLPRCEAWNRRRASLNSECAGRAWTSLADLDAAELSTFSLCLACDLDQFPAGEVTALCERSGIPYMLIGCEGGRGLLEPLFVPGLNPCPRCVASPLLRPAKGEEAVPPLRSRLLRSALADLAALQALKLLSGFAAANNLDERLRLDLDTYEILAEAPAAGRCPGCEEAAAIPPAVAAASGEEELLGGAAHPDSRVTLFPLVESRDGDQFILGREETGTFLSLGELERRFLRLLEQGMTLRRAREAFGRCFDIPDVKIGTFLATLAESGFIAKVDGRPLREEPRERRFLLTGLQPRHVSFLFSRPAFALYGLLWLAAAVLLVRHPQYLPRYRDVYFLPSLSLSLIVNALMGWLIVMPHELFHLFAAKSVGCEAGIEIGHRLMFVVAQTDVTNLWKVPRRKRNLVYLAGMISDLVIASALIFALWLSDRGTVALHPYVYGFCKSVLFIIAFKLGWNFLFYMRTDLYYFLANLLRCQNLYGDTVAFLRNELAREVPWIRPVSADPVPERERIWVRLYAVFFLVGTLLTVGVFSVALLPLGLLVRNAISSGITAGVAGHRIFLVDSVVASSLILLQLALLAYAVMASRRKRRLVAR